MVLEFDFYNINLKDLGKSQWKSANLFRWRYILFIYFRQQEIHK